MKKIIYLVYAAQFLNTWTVAQPLDLEVLNIPYNQNFNTLSSSGSSSVLPRGWSIFETGTGEANNGLFTASSGNLNGGDTYSFGENASPERALGGLRSSSVVPLFGCLFTNSSSEAITSLKIQYHGEQWRLGATQRGNDRLDFQISFDATTLTNGTWMNVDVLDFVSPVSNGATGMLNGNLNTVSIEFELTEISIGAGQTFGIRWVDVDVANSDDGLAVDNFTLTPGGNATQPFILMNHSAIVFGDVNVGQEKTLIYNVQGVNLSDSITVNVGNALFSISKDAINYDTVCSLPLTGGEVYLRFIPVSNGHIESTVVHVSGDCEMVVQVSGVGFDQVTHIIPIVDARTMPDGEKVTVAGRITVGPELRNLAFIQDDSGGIPVFDHSFTSSVAIGDSVIVTGFISQFNDQKQISGPDVFFKKLPAFPQIVSPKLIPLNALSANDGILVQVNGVEIVNKNFVFFPNTSEQITDGNTSIELRIDGDTNIPGLQKPQASTSIVGVVTRFKDNVQLTPRFASDIVDAAIPLLSSDTIPEFKTLDVANWNLEFFGANREDYAEEFGPSDESLQLVNISRVLDSLKADVIAVQEISDEAYLDSLVTRLPNYDYICSKRYSYSFDGPTPTFPPQKVCFVFNTLTVDVLSTRSMFVGLYDSARLIDPYLLANYPTGDPSSFYSSGRLPFLLNAKVTINGISERVTFISLHAKSGSSDQDFNRRSYDAQVLKDSLDQGHKSKNIIILGDFNDDLDLSIVPGFPSSFENFLADANYVAITKSLSEAGARSTMHYNDVIDHQIIKGHLRKSYIEGSASIITPFQFIHNYSNTTSDHLPVFSRYVLTHPKAKFTSSAATVVESDTTLEVTVLLSRAAEENLFVQVSIDGDAEYGLDYHTSPLTNSEVIDLAFSQGDSMATFQVFIAEDELDEFNESVTCSILPSDKIEGAMSTYAVIVEDNDTPMVEFVSNEQQLEEGMQTSIKIVLSTPIKSNETITVKVEHENHVLYNADYETDPPINNGLLQIPVIAGSSEIPFSFAALADRSRDKNERVDFTILETSSDLALGIEVKMSMTILDKKFTPEFSVYPNPTSDHVHLTWNQIPGDSLFEINIRKRSGEIIFESTGTMVELNENVANILGQCRKGIYYFSLVYEDEVCTIRIVKE